MRLGFADIRKSVLRRDGAAYVAPQLLGPRAPLRQIAALIALYESQLGTARAAFPQDAPAELIGDYRLARCLVICLDEWYRWESSAWPDGVTEVEARALAERGVTSPTHLRLALYDAVNREHGGYLTAASRESTLDAFASACGIGRATLDTLLFLDHDERAVLRRVTDNPPSEYELVTRYNQQVVEALLANSASVEWTLPPTVVDPAGGGLGAVVKRICFLARRMGVQYDVAYEPDDREPITRAADPGLARVAEHRQLYAAPVASETQPDTLATSLDSCLRPLHITLYGPQEVSAAPAQYGERLARLCRALVGYRRQSGGAALASDGVRGLAGVYLHGRPVTFVLDDRVLRLVSGNSVTETADDLLTTSQQFDSRLEAGLHDEFAALERVGEAQGWHIEREPEPVLAAETVLVPDFALTRGTRRIYLEIAGYWRHEYRERKLRKLRAVREVVALLVAVPETAREQFAPLVGEMPLLWYRTRVSARSLLDALETAYGDADTRLAAIDVERVGAEVQRRGRIPPDESAHLLSCYSRNELADAVARLQAAALDDASQPYWIDGIGLCSAAWRDGVLDRLRQMVAEMPGGRMSLAALRNEIAVAMPDLADVSEAQVEALVQLAGLPIQRASIFEAEVLASAVDDAPETPAQPTGQTRKAQPRSAPRRKHPSTSHTMSSIFPSERVSGNTTGTSTPPSTTS